VIQERDIGRLLDVVSAIESDEADRLVAVIGEGHGSADLSAGGTTAV